MNSLTRTLTQILQENGTAGLLILVNYTNRRTVELTRDEALSHPDKDKDIWLLKATIER